MTRRLDSLSIKNYRQLKDIQIEGIGDINLIVGQNNSGKSTLLDAIRLLSSRGSSDLIEEILIEHGEFELASDNPVDSLARGRAVCNLFTERRFPDRDRSAIYVGDVLRKQFLEMEHVFLEEELVEKLVDGEQSTIRRLRKISKNEALDLQNADDALEITIPAIPDLLSFSSEKTTAILLTDLFGPRRPMNRLQHVGSMPIIPSSYVSSRSTTQDELADVWDEVVLTKAEDYVLKALRLIEPHTDGLAFIQSTSKRASRNYLNRRAVDERHAMLRMENLEAPVSLQSMGDGMTRVLQLILNALKARNGFLLIDEFENGLHYSIQEQVWRLLFQLAAENQMQVFATTHSDDCVRAFSSVATENSLKGVLIKVERTEDEGQSVVSSVTEIELSALMSSSVDVR